MEVESVWLEDMESWGDDVCDWARDSFARINVDDSYLKGNKDEVLLSFSSVTWVGRCSLLCSCPDREMAGT